MPSTGGTRTPIWDICDLVADLNAEDDEGLGWSVLDEARDPSRIRRGVMLVAGNDRHLIGRALA